MNGNPAVKSIDRIVSTCSSCFTKQDTPDFSENRQTESASFEFSQSLNSENSILFFSSIQNSSLFEIFQYRFPSEILTGLVAQIKIIITAENPIPVLQIKEEIFINPDFSIRIILDEFEKLFFPLFNQNSVNGFKQSVFIESTLFGRGNQLNKHKTLIFWPDKIKKDIFSGIELKDTEQLQISTKLIFYRLETENLYCSDETENAITVNEKCSTCNSVNIISVFGRKENSERISADKIISFTDANQKLPFFSRTRPDQLQLLQFLFSPLASKEITHYNNFLKKYSLKHPHLEWFVVNSDLLTDNSEPNLFINDADSFSKIIVEALKGTLMWRKDKFLDLHSANKLSGSKIKIHDPLQILGEATYKSKIMDWIRELEESGFEKFGFGFKTIFR